MSTDIKMIGEMTYPRHCFRVSIGGVTVDMGGAEAYRLFPNDITCVHPFGLKQWPVEYRLKKERVRP